MPSLLPYQQNRTPSSLLPFSRRTPLPPFSIPFSLLPKLTTSALSLPLQDLQSFSFSSLLFSSDSLKLSSISIAGGVLAAALAFRRRERRLVRKSLIFLVVPHVVLPSSTSQHIFLSSSSLFQFGRRVGVVFRRTRGRPAARWGLSLVVLKSVSFSYPCGVDFRTKFPLLS